MLRLIAAAPVLCAVLMTACGETAITLFDEVNAAPPLSVTYVLEGGAGYGLRSLDVVVEELELLRAEDVGAPVVDGALPKPVEVELLGLDDCARVLTTRYYGPGDYTHLRVRFPAEAASAVDLAGGPVDLEPQPRRALTLALETPLSAAWGEALGATLVVAIDPDASLVSETAAAFRPSVRVRTLLPGETLRTAGLWGRVVQVSDDLRSLQIADEMARTVGDEAVLTNVAVHGATLLLQPDGQPAPGLGSLQPDPALAEARFWIRGQFLGSATGWLPLLSASSVLLDRLTPSDPTDASWLMQARVVARHGGGHLTVRPLDFVRGESSAQDVLAGLARPDALEIEMGPNSLVLRADGTRGGLQDLRVGSRVELHFGSFATEPFQAARAAIVTSPEHCGVLHELQPGSGQLFIRLEPDSSAIEGGLVDSSETLVTLTPTTVFARLAVQGGVSVPIASLRSGLRVIVDGRVTGLSIAPLIQASQVTVLPGRFRGAVGSISRAEGSFEASVEVFQAPFGGDTASPPLRVRLAPGCAFGGETASVSAFFDAFEALAPGASLEVQVAGIAAINANEVTAYEVQSRVR